MGMLTRIKAALGIENEPETSPSVPLDADPVNRHVARHPRTDAAAVAPAEPVAIDLAGHHTEADRPDSPGDSSMDVDAELPESERRLPSRKAKQELITELQKNYKEVLELVRRVQTHLDTQEERSARLMEIAERVPEALDALPEHAERTERLIGAVQKMHQTSGATRDATQQNARELARVNEQLSQSAHAERELVTTMQGFHEAARDLAGNNQKAAGAVKDLATRTAERDHQLAEAIADGRRWLIIGIGVTAGAAATAVILAALALIN